MEKTNNKLKGAFIVALICGMLVATYSLPVLQQSEIVKETPVRSWHTVDTWAVGDLDISYSAGNSSILAIWIVNHTTDGHVCYGNHSGGSDDTGDHHAWQNDSTQFNNSVTVYGYAQKSGFDIDVPHSTAINIVILVRANLTNAATGSTATDQYNATWVSLNVSGYGIYDDVATAANWTRFVTHNVSGDPFMYIKFVYNGTEALQGHTDDQNIAQGTGDTIPRNNRTFFTMQLNCYY